MRIYYLTNCHWAEVILRERRLKLSRFHESNDPFELRLIDDRSRSIRKYTRIIADYFEKNVGMLCFGENWRSPPMWAHYAEKHAGVCLGFDAEESLLTTVEYTDEKIRVDFGRELPQFGLSQPLLRQLLTTKSKHWSYERERRILAHLEVCDPKTALFYHDFDHQLVLRELILGCRCPWSDADARRYLGAVSAVVHVLKARPAFGRFEMVERQDFPCFVVSPTPTR